MNADLPALTTMNLTHILSEVRVHGFCVMHCASLLKQSSSVDEMKKTICELANAAGLKVSFNDERLLCVFEQR